MQNHHWIQRFFLVALTFLICLHPALQASNQFKPEPVQAFTGNDASPWARVERLVDPHPGFTQEAFCPAGVQADPLIAKWFGGNKTPHSGQFLLHCYKGYDQKAMPTPVLLVHGAGDNADRGWVHPFDATLPASLSPEKMGFACKLADLGFAVFAITFSHNQGDNFMQAEQIANAIRRIRVLMHRENDPNFKIDIVAHSKGNVPVRVYCSDGPAIYPKKTYLSHYRHDVRKFIAIASPMLGMDTPFRYYAYNLTMATNPGNAPLGVDKLLLYWVWKDVKEMSLFKDSKNYWPGQSQILYNLVRDADIPLGVESMTADGQSAFALYNGGTSLALASRGIDKAIADGEQLIYKLEAKGIDPSITLGVIAGNNPYLSCHVPGLGYIPMTHEILSAPFDGLLFVKSATWTKGILRNGAKLLGVKVLNLNHLRLSMFPESLKVVDEWLMAPTAADTTSLKDAVKAIYPGRSDESEDLGVSAPQ